MLRHLDWLAGRKERSASAAASRRARPAAVRRPRATEVLSLAAERLEERQALNAGPIVGQESATVVVAVDASNRLCVTSQGTRDDNLLIAIDAANDNLLRLTLASGTLGTEIPGAAGSGAGSLQIPRAAFAGQPVVVDLGGGNDALRLGFQQGLFNVVYAGGESAESTGDLLKIEAASFSKATFSYGGSGPPQAGTIVLEQNGAGSATVSFTGLEPIDATSATIDQLTFNLPGTGDLPVLEDNGAAGDGASRLRSRAATPTFETTTFKAPTGSLRLNLGPDAAALTIDSLPDFSGVLLVDGQDGADAVQFKGTIALASLSVVGVEGGVINDPATSLSVSGPAAFDAGSGDVVLGNQTGDNLAFGQLTAVGDQVAVTVETALNLVELRARQASLAAGTNIASAANANIEVLELAELTAPGTVSLGAGAESSVTFGRLKMSAPTTASLALDADVVLEEVTAGALTVTSTGSIAQAAGATLAASGAATFEAGGALTLDQTFAAASLKATGASVVVRKKQDLAVDAASSAGSIELTSTEGNVTVNGPVKGASVRISAPLGDIDLKAAVEATGLASLTAGDGPILATAEAARLTAAQLALRATRGIGASAPLATQAATIAFANSASGQVNLLNAGALAVGNVDGLTASLAVDGGSLRAQSPLAILHNVTAGRTFVFTAADSPAAGDNLTIGSGVTIASVNPGAELRFVAGDNFLFPPGAALTAGGAVTVVVDDPANDVDEPDVGSLVNFQGTVAAPSVALTGGDDNDSFIVTPNLQTAIGIDGGPPTQSTLVVPPGDTLILSLPQGIELSNEPGLPNGTADFKGEYKDVVYQSIERLVFVRPDNLGPNNSLLSATFLGSPIFASFNGLSIDSAFDQDFFQYRAHMTGTLTVAISYEQLIGELQLAVQDRRGNVIALSQTAGDDELLQIPVVQGEAYFIVVSGVDGAVNNYGLEVENFAAPSPALVDLVAASDSGVSNSDNLTNDVTPTFQIQVDLLTFLDLNRDFALAPGDGDDVVDGGEEIPVLSAAEAAAGDRYGAAVEVVLANAATGALIRGFADPLSATQPLLFRMTTETALADGAYQVSARVRMFDSQHDAAGAIAPASGGGLLSAPLTITIDATRPAPPTLALEPASDTGTPLAPGSRNDRITADSTPNFQGAAEPGSVVRLFADALANDAIDVPGTFRIVQAAPLGGPGSGGGAWAASFVRNLNDPAQFPLADGLREIAATAEDLAGNVSDPAFLDLFLDTQGPQVAGVFVAGSTFNLWSPKPSEGPTPAVRSLRINFVDFPERIVAAGPGSPTFAHDAVAPNAFFAESYLLVGDRTGPVAIKDVVAVAPSAADGEPASSGVVLNFFAPLPDDRYTLTIRDSVSDPAGNALDGETNFSAPSPAPFTASGDGVNGGNFVGRFTVDSRAELGVWGGGFAHIDANGNFRWDAQGAPTDHPDLAFRFGLTADNLFAGNFVQSPDAAANGFDKLAVYGSIGTGGNRIWRWLIDFDGDGVPEVGVNDGRIDGIPVAGNFDGNAENGDEVGVFDGQRWWIDADHDFQVSDESPIAASYRGFPVVGDFDGDGQDDFAVYQENRFAIDLDRNGTADLAFQVGVGPLGTAGGFVGFPGVRERPVAADMDGDGIDDLGIWAPDGFARSSSRLASWYFLLSADNPDTVSRESVLTRVLEGQVGFSPAPLGTDLHVELGDPFAVPIAGNFDPPAAPSAAVARQASAAPPSAAAKSPAAIVPQAQTSPLAPTPASPALTVKAASSSVKAAPATAFAAAPAAVTAASAASQSSRNRKVPVSIAASAAPKKTEGPSTPASAPTAAAVVAAPQVDLAASGPQGAAAAAASPTPAPKVATASAVDAAFASWASSAAPVAERAAVVLAAHAAPVDALSPIAAPPPASAPRTVLASVPPPPMAAALAAPAGEAVASSARRRALPASVGSPAAAAAPPSQGAEVPPSAVVSSGQSASKATPLASIPTVEPPTPTPPSPPPAGNKRARAVRWGN